jgi:hypothetical protein
MKTPRELLLHQHREHDAHLERIQDDVIATSLPNRAKRMECARLAAAFLCSPKNVAWRELILPARRIWLTYSFIWLAIATLHFATADHPAIREAKTSNPAEAIANWKEQQTILAELTKQPEHEPADRPKPHPMRPRSEATHTAMG